MEITIGSFGRLGLICLCSNVFVACPFQDTPTLVKLDSGERTPLNLERSSDASKSESYNACFTYRGDRLLIGSSRGFVYIFDTATAEVRNSAAR